MCFLLIAAQFCRALGLLTVTSSLCKWHVQCSCAKASLRPSNKRVFCQLAQTCCWGRGNLYLEHVLHYCRFDCYMLKENDFLGCGQSLLCELKSQSHKHLAYAERLKLPHSFLKFGPAGTAACVTCTQTAKVSCFFLVVSWNLLVKVNICKVLHG